MAETTYILFIAMQKRNIMEGANIKFRLTFLGKIGI